MGAGTCFFAETPLFRDFPRNDDRLDIHWGAPDSSPLFGGKWGAGRHNMKKQPKQKLSINKETIRRLSPAELAMVRGGDVTQEVLTPDQQDLDGTYRECVV